LKIEDRGSRIEDRDPQSSILDPRSSIFNQKGCDAFSMMRQHHRATAPDVNAQATVESRPWRCAVSVNLAAAGLQAIKALASPGPASAHQRPVSDQGGKQNVFETLKQIIHAVHFLRGFFADCALCRRRAGAINHLQHSFD
jgi:hypothetical protein